MRNGFPASYLAGATEREFHDCPDFTIVLQNSVHLGAQRIVFILYGSGFVGLLHHAN